MNVDQTVVVGVTLVILLALFVSMFDYIVPMIVKFEFDAICRNYILISESQNGLSDENVQAFTSEIEQLGVMDVSIRVAKVDEVKRGMVNAIEVKGTYQVKGFVSLFVREDKSVSFNFKKDYLARKIVM